MWKLSLGAAALAFAAPAMAQGLSTAQDLGCWDPDAISANSAPTGTYLNTAASVDYIQPMHEGVDALLADLSAFSTGSFVVCMEGEPAVSEGDDVWQLSAAIICSIGAYSAGSCPG